MDEQKWARSLVVILDQVVEHFLYRYVLVAEDDGEQQHVYDFDWLVPNLKVLLAEHVILDESCLLEIIPDYEFDDALGTASLRETYIHNLEKFWLIQLSELIKGEIVEYELYDNIGIGHSMGSFINLLELPVEDLVDIIDSLSVDGLEHIE